MTAPVAPARIEYATSKGMANVDVAAVVCREVGTPFAAALALFEQESGGRHRWHNDPGGVFSGVPLDVTRGAYDVFRYYVIEKGEKSNGCGISAITFAGKVLPDGSREGGYFRQMEAEGLKPWDVHDNAFFGLRLLRENRVKHRLSWAQAYTVYQGGPSVIGTVSPQGRLFEAKRLAWVHGFPR